MAVARVTQGSEIFRPATSPWSVDGVGSPAALDYIVLVLTADSNPAVTSVPAGFSQLIQPITEPANDFITYIYGGFGEDLTAPYSVAWSPNAAGGAAWVSYSGVDLRNPSNAWRGQNSGGSSSAGVTTPALIPTMNQAMLIGVADTESGVATTATWTVGTEVIDFNNVGGTPGIGIWIGELTYPGFAATSLSATLTTSRATTKITLALNPEYGSQWPSVELQAFPDKRRPMPSFYGPGEDVIMRQQERATPGS